MIECPVVKIKARLDYGLEVKDSSKYFVCILRSAGPNTGGIYSLVFDRLCLQWKN